MVVVLVGLRLVVALLLVAGPWTDDAHELAGWDVARFQELADAPVRPYRDFAVEYPPGTLVVVEALAGSDVTVTHDRMVVLCLGTDLLLAGMLARARGRRSSVAYLAMGTALLPAIYLRLDLLAALLASVALLAADRTGARSGGRASVVGAAALPAGFLVKLWPLVLLPALIVARRWRAAVAAAAGVVVATTGWAAWGGAGAFGQVLGHRGSRGWHVESVVGAVVGLVTGAPARLEGGAYRLGSAPAWAKAVLLAASTAAAGAAWFCAWRRLSQPVDVAAGEPGEATANRPVPTTDDLPHGSAGALPSRGSDEPAVMALAAITAVAALLAGSVLLSPQFLAWLLPFAAICWAQGELAVAGLAAAAMVVTSATLAWFGPPGLDQPVAEALLVFRGGLLVAVVAAGLGRLRGRSRPWARVPAGASAS